MPTKIDHIKALSRVCRRFGGQLAVISQHAFDSLFDEPAHRHASPRSATRAEATRMRCAADHTYGEGLNKSPSTFGHGLLWRQKIIYTVHGRGNVNGIIHEMGHVFASPHHPGCACYECHEWNWLGWEIILARQIGVMPLWSYHNADYNVVDVGNIELWGRLTPTRRRVVVADRITHAQKAGFLGANNALKSLR